MNEIGIFWQAVEVEAQPNRRGAPDDDNEPRVRFLDVIYDNSGATTSRDGQIRRALLSESLRRRQEHGFDFQSFGASGGGSPFASATSGRRQSLWTGE